MKRLLDLMMLTTARRKGARRVDTNEAIPSPCVGVRWLATVVPLLALSACGCSDPDQPALDTGPDASGGDARQDAASASDASTDGSSGGDVSTDGDALDASSDDLLWLIDIHRSTARPAYEQRALICGDPGVCPPGFTPEQCANNSVECALLHDGTWRAIYSVPIAVEADDWLTLRGAFVATNLNPEPARVHGQIYVDGQPVGNLAYAELGSHVACDADPGAACQDHQPLQVVGRWRPDVAGTAVAELRAAVASDPQSPGGVLIESYHGQLAAMQWRRTTGGHGLLMPLASSGPGADHYRGTPQGQGFDLQALQYFLPDSEGGEAVDTAPLAAGDLVYLSGQGSMMAKPGDQLVYAVGVDLRRRGEADECGLVNPSCGIGRITVGAHSVKGLARSLRETTIWAFAVDSIDPALEGRCARYQLFYASGVYSNLPLADAVAHGVCEPDGTAIPSSMCDPALIDYTQPISGSVSPDVGQLLAWHFRARDLEPSVFGLAAAREQQGAGAVIPVPPNSWQTVLTEQIPVLAGDVILATGSAQLLLTTGVDAAGVCNLQIVSDGTEATLKGKPVRGPLNRRNAELPLSVERAGVVNAAGTLEVRLQAYCTPTNGTPTFALDPRGSQLMTDVYSPVQ